MGRLGTREDVGDVVALFCFEQAGWTMGQLVLCGWRRITHDVRGATGNTVRDRRETMKVMTRVADGLSAIRSLL
jgi:hypothetical protein